MPPSLIRFLPNRVWRTYQGGAVLDALEGRENPADSHLPEDWIGSTTVAVNPVERPAGEGLARVATTGEPLFRDLLAEAPEHYLGASHLAAHGGDPQLLVKFLDSAIRLHFQAHPTAAFARAHGLGPSGKAEAYHILEVRPDVADPYIYLGFQRPPSKEAFKKIIENQDIAALEKCFDRIPVEVGQTWFIPGGRPHAIGPGILMVEVMEPSDLAVRFEFERGGYVLPESARFMGRGLDFCLDVFDYEPISVAQAIERYRCDPQANAEWPRNGSEFHLLEADRNPCFSLRRSTFAGNGKTHRWNPGRAFFGIVTRGTGELRTAEGEVLSLQRFDRIFVAAHAASTLTVIPTGPEPLEILESYPPTPPVS